MSCNENITWDIIDDNSDEKYRWHWSRIAGNSMKLGKEKWINNLRLKTIKALQIQRHWRNYASNPLYKLAQDLIKDKLNS